jgi:hypothetical protein
VTNPPIIRVPHVVVKSKETICGKCGEEMDWEEGCVNPIDEEGRNLGRVPMCWKCLEQWKKVYKSANLKRYGYAWKYQKEWVKLWKKFMKGDYDREEVEFT